MENRLILTLQDGDVYVNFKKKIIFPDDKFKITVKSLILEVNKSNPRPYNLLVFNSNEYLVDLYKKYHAGKLTRECNAQEKKKIGTDFIAVYNWPSGFLHFFPWTNKKDKILGGYKETGIFK
jgi:hypothetical protein